MKHFIKKKVQMLQLLWGEEAAKKCLHKISQKFPVGLRDFFCSAIALYKEDFLTRSRRYIVFSAIAFIMRYNICIDGDFFTPHLSLSGTVRAMSLARSGV